MVILMVIIKLMEVSTHATLRVATDAMEAHLKAVSVSTHATLRVATR